MGYALVRAIIPDDYLSNPGTFCATIPHPNAARAFTIEFMNCFIFMTFVAAILHPKNSHNHGEYFLNFNFNLFKYFLIIIELNFKTVQPSSLAS